MKLHQLPWYALLALLGGGERGTERQRKRGGRREKERERTKLWSYLLDRKSRLSIFDCQPLGRMTEWALVVERQCTPGMMHLGAIGAPTLLFAQTKR